MFKYIYQSDLDKYGTLLDIWEVISPDANGVYRGDCESYCRTLKKLDSVYKDWDYYYCKLDGVGHCVLIKGDSTTGIIEDCNCQMPMSIDKYKEIYSVSGFMKYSKFQVISKIILANLFLMYRSIREKFTKTV